MKVLLLVLVVAAAALDSESEEQTDAPNFTYAGQLPDQVQELPDSGEVPAVDEAATNNAVRDISLAQIEQINLKNYCRQQLVRRLVGGDLCGGSLLQ